MTQGGDLGPGSGEVENPAQNSPAVVREIGDRITQIISDYLHQRTKQPITDSTSVAELRAPSTSLSLDMERPTAICWTSSRARLSPTLW